MDSLEQSALHLLIIQGGQFLLKVTVDSHKIYKSWPP